MYSPHLVVAGALHRFSLLLMLALPGSATTLLTVTTSSDAVNGDTSDADALRRDPGPDGISLREAVSVATQGLVVEFDGALADTTIFLGGPLPAITHPGVTIRGFARGDGEPAITISGAQQNETRGAFAVSAGDFHLSGLRIENVVRAAAVLVDASRGESGTLRGVHIEGMVFRHTASGPGSALTVTNGNVANRVARGITIVGNRFLQWDGCAVEILGQSTGGLITDVLIDRNVFQRGGASGCGIALGTTDTSASAAAAELVVSRNQISGYLNGSLGIGLGTQGTSATVSDVVIYDNEFRGTSFPIESVGSGQNGLTTRTSIISNRFLGNENGITLTNIGLPGRPPSSGNRHSEVLISANLTIGNSQTAMMLEGGGASSSGNLLSGVRIVNNVLARNGINAVIISGGGNGVENNVVDDVLLVNNTIEQATFYPLAIPSNFGTIVRNVRVINSILSTTNPLPILGEPPLAVRSCILHDTRYAGLDGNIAADPGFVAPFADDYRLRSGSPAIDSAAVDAAPAADVLCRERLTPDRGAYERNAPATVRLVQIVRGGGAGTVDVDHAGVPCESLGFARIDGYAPGSIVIMRAVPAPGSFLRSWGGDVDCIDGAVTLNADTLCTAVFEKPARRRAVRR